MTGDERHASGHDLASRNARRDQRSRRTSPGATPAAAQTPVSSASDRASTSAATASSQPAPERGDNAVVKMSAIIQQVTGLNKKLKQDGFLGKGTVAVTSVECKTPSLNAVPDECTIYLDRRLTLGAVMLFQKQQFQGGSFVSALQTAEINS